MFKKAIVCSLSFLCLSAYGMDNSKKVKTEEALFADLTNSEIQKNLGQEELDKMIAKNTKQPGSSTTMIVSNSKLFKFHPKRSQQHSKL
jgi:hypothetical protein